MFKLFKSENDRNIKKLEKIANVIEGKADYYKSLTDEELKATTKTTCKRWRKTYGHFARCLCSC